MAPLATSSFPSAPTLKSSTITSSDDFKVVLELVSPTCRSS
ncbi:unnamed protein product [Haemonchus placei]|uniref:Uncharacterized protein n=1 Tax=Haemonchus placei TaxID=6290 RepID=A0A0N4XBT4_HAEPC|nr:unnamed protein product [Haemonchus placei]